MTRETKIGLLVGLAFIIVVGILLSDHMAATTELPQAPLETAERTGHGAVVPPGETRNVEIARVITPIDVPPPAPIPTREELTAHPPVVEQAHGPAVAQNGNPAVATGNPMGDVARAAAQHGEAIVDAGNHDLIPANTDQTQAHTAKPAAGPKVYVAESGDNLSKIAQKTMGASTRATREAILKANPKLAANPDRIVVGQSYVIPSAAAPAATAVLPLSTPKVAEKPAKPARGDSALASASPSYFYTVKENDNLWHIAQEQLGNGSAYTAIKELNKETLKGTDAVRVGMKLRLPAKPLAMAD